MKWSTDGSILKHHLDNRHVRYHLKGTSLCIYILILLSSQVNQDTVQVGLWYGVICDNVSCECDTVNNLDPSYFDFKGLYPYDRRSSGYSSIRCLDKQFRILYFKFLVLNSIVHVLSFMEINCFTNLKKSISTCIFTLRSTQVIVTNQERQVAVNLESKFRRI